MEDIKTMWRNRLPIAVIATEHNLKRKEVIAELGDAYTKNEAHYRANEYRDKQRLIRFATWYDKHFDLSELQVAINQGKLQAYWKKIAEPEKMTVPAVRDFVTSKLGRLPERTTPRSKYDPATYKLGVKSKYFGREQELINMWQVNQMSIESISRKTGVSKRTLSKLLKPKGYNSGEIRSQIAKSQSQIRRKKKLHSIMERMNDEDIDFWRNAIVNKQLGQVMNERARYYNIRPIDFRRLLYKERADIKQLAEDAKSSSVKTFVDNLTPSQVNEFKLSDNRRSWIEQNKPEDIQGVSEIWRQLLLKYPETLTSAWTKRKQIVVPLDYIGQIPEWIWRYVDKQDDTVLLDKLVSFCADYESITAMLTDAERVTGHKISFKEIDRYLPLIDGVADWSRLIRQNFPNDDGLSELTGGFSSYENKVYDLLKSLNVDFVVHNRSLGFELDFYLPELKLAIECSPLATHNSNEYAQFGIVFVPKSPKYHYNKYKIASEHGIHLVTLFEKQLDDSVWFDKTVPMLRRLVLGHADMTIYARETVVRSMNQPNDKKLVDAFLERHHMDGKTPAKFRYGMFYQNELVAVATFATPVSEKYKDNHIELKRLAFKSDIQVRYGISKFIAHFRQDNPDYKYLMTYSNNNMGYGNGYQQVGFKFIKETGAQLTFVNPKDIHDTYSWSIATSWGAKSGVIASLLGSRKIDNAQARALVETELPHRTDSGVGYVAQYDSGNKLWVLDL